MKAFIGSGAPNFSATAVMPDNSVQMDFELGKYILGKYAVLFFYAVNYSYVCPTELIALNNRMADLKKRNAVVVAVSVDSHLSHLNWKSLPPEKGGVGALRFPLISDISKKISELYGVLLNDSLSMRATYLIDRQGYIRNQMIFDFPIGRNIDEILRVIDAQRYHEETGQICPANWLPGNLGIEYNEKDLGLFMRHQAEDL